MNEQKTKALSKIFFFLFGGPMAELNSVLSCPSENPSLQLSLGFKLRFWPQKVHFAINPFPSFFFASSSLFFSFHRY
jgi:hypothetical protein